MFGTNTITGKKFFENLSQDEVKVQSIFFTVQGEGPKSGHHAVFVRFSHCNLNCQFCDTYFEDGQVMTFSQILKSIDVAKADTLGSLGNPLSKDRDDCNEWAMGTEDEPSSKVGLVITGGEPLLQPNLLRFIDYFQNDMSCDPEFPWVQIETNGILPWQPPKSDRFEMLTVVSPKCTEFLDRPNHHIKPHPTTLENASCLKFVVEANPKSSYHVIPDWAFEWRKQTGKDIFVAPMAIYNEEPQDALIIKKTQPNISLETRSSVLERISLWTPGLFNMEECEKNYEYAASLVMRYGFRPSPQIHLFMNLP